MSDETFDKMADAVALSLRWSGGGFFATFFGLTFLEWAVFAVAVLVIDMAFAWKSCRR